MARRPTAAAVAEAEVTTQTGGNGALPAEVDVFTSATGEAIYRLRTDGSMFDTLEELQDYVAENQVEILVNSFMDHVDENLGYYIGKKGKKGAEPTLPEKERAVMAMKTRLRNAATHALSWYLTHGHGE